MKKILLVGPYVKNKQNSKAYGGGTGGYVRNMITYINYFKSPNFKIIPCFNTFRGQLKLDFFVWRFFIDSTNFIKEIYKNKPDAVHILGQYRTAIPREFFICFIANLMSIPILYELKAGDFINWYTRTNNRIFKWMAKYVCKKSGKLLVEGVKYIPFLKEEFNLESTYFPNYIPSAIIPQTTTSKLTGNSLKMLFVGYCYRGKGVFELIEACNISAKKGIKIELTLVGQEHEEFSQWLDNKEISENLTINRKGRQSYDFVLDQFSKNDVYCYPTRHSGEGHNNTINEAMMFGLIIITTKQGFLGSIITDKNGYSIDTIDPPVIAKTIDSIIKFPELAKTKGQKAKETLVTQFSSDKLYPILEKAYFTLTSK